MLLAGAELGQTDLANGEVLPEGRIVATIPESISELVLADLNQEITKEQGILACVTIALETGRQVPLPEALRRFPAKRMYDVEGFTRLGLRWFQWMPFYLSECRCYKRFSEGQTPLKALPLLAAALYFLVSSYMGLRVSHQARPDLPSMNPEDQAQASTDATGKGHGSPGQRMPASKPCCQGSGGIERTAGEEAEAVCMVGLLKIPGAPPLYPALAVRQPGW